MKQKDHASLFEDDLSCMHEERVYKKAEVPQKKGDGFTQYFND